MREGDAGLVARLLQGIERSLEIAFTHEDVEVLGVAFDARVAGERISPADEHVDARPIEDLERGAVEGALLVGERMVRRRGHSRTERTRVAQGVPRGSSRTGSSRRVAGE